MCRDRLEKQVPSSPLEAKYNICARTQRRQLVLQQYGIRKLRLQENSLIQYSKERRTTNLELREYLYANLYYNPEVHKPNQRGVKLLEALFAHYLEHPENIGSQSRARIETDGLHRAISRLRHLGLSRALNKWQQHAAQAIINDLYS